MRVRTLVGGSAVASAVAAGATAHLDRTHERDTWSVKSASAFGAVLGASGAGAVRPLGGMNRRGAVFMAAGLGLGTLVAVDTRRHRMDSATTSTAGAMLIGVMFGLTGVGISTQFVGARMIGQAISRVKNTLPERNSLAPQFHPDHDSVTLWLAAQADHEGNWNFDHGLAGEMLSKAELLRAMSTAT